MEGSFKPPHRGVTSGIGSPPGVDLDPNSHAPLERMSCKWDPAKGFNKEANIRGSVQFCVLCRCAFGLDCCSNPRTRIAKNNGILQSFRRHEADETKQIEVENITNDLSCFHQDTMSSQDDSAV